MDKFKSFIKQYFVLVILIFLIILFGCLQPESFLTMSNFFTVVRQSSIMGIATIGLLFVMIAGGIDLSLGSVPLPVILFIVVIIIAGIVLNRTYIGRHFYAIGSNEEAARLSGINTGKLKVATYAIGGFLSGLAGLIMLARISSGQPTAGKNMEMDCLTAAVIGGVSLTGGEGRISTAVCGVLIIGVLTNGMTILNISEYYQLIIRGCIFLGAVCLDGIQKQLAGRKKVKKVA